MWIKELLIPGILAIITALCSYMVHALKENRKVGGANAKGTMLLLRRQIIASHDKFCKAGDPISHFDYKDVTEIYEAYKALGGNGLTDRMFEDIKALDITGGTE